MNYVCTLISVKDIEKSKRFYHDVLGLEVLQDLGANVALTGGLALQTMETWETFIGRSDITLQNNAVELVFEEQDLDAFLEKLKTFPIDYVHDVLEHEWGQRVVRFYDPDYHIIEVGEDMRVVVRRFHENGMTEEQIAARMGVPLAYVQDCTRN